jgi:hypothetical protein
MRLLEMKRRCGLLDEETAGTIKARIGKAQELMGRIDASGTADESLRPEIRELFNLSSICEKKELEWPVKRRKVVKPAGVLRYLLSPRP